MSETRQQFYSDRWQLVEERLDASTDPDRQFVWGLRYIDDLVLRDRDTNADGTLDERLYAMQDPNWNVVAVSSDSGAIQERYAYEPYGEVTKLSAAFGASSATIAWDEILYAGYRYESRTGLYYVRYRYCHPALGRWTSRDALEESSSRALYPYIFNSPIVLTDPSGMRAVSCPSWSQNTGWQVDSLELTNIETWGEMMAESFGSRGKYPWYTDNPGYAWLDAGLWAEYTFSAAIALRDKIICCNGKTIDVDMALGIKANVLHKLRNRRQTLTRIVRSTVVPWRINLLLMSFSAPAALEKFWTAKKVVDFWNALNENTLDLTKQHEICNFTKRLDTIEVSASFSISLGAICCLPISHLRVRGDIYVPSYKIAFGIDDPAYSIEKRRWGDIKIF